MTDNSAALLVFGAFVLACISGLCLAIAITHGPSWMYAVAAWEAILSINAAIGSTRR
jgi:hypothetical protein